jgi:cell filamentation protein
MPPKFVDPYAYPGTDVLKNKPGIRNEQVLRTFEYEQTARRAQELNRKPIAGEFDLDHLKAIHKHLFQDVYAWAGEVRTVNISKDALGFAPAPYIESYGRTVAADLAKENYLKGLGKPKFVERLAHHFTELNVLHPFREGNGRSTREFVGQLARNAGYELDQTRIDNSKDQWNQAAARGRAGDLKPLQAIFTESIRPAKAVAFDNDKPPMRSRNIPSCARRS